MKAASRAVGALFLASLVVVVGLWARAEWVAGAGPTSGQLLQQDEKNVVGDDPWSASEDRLATYRPSKPYNGGTEVEVRPAGDGNWYITTSYRLVLQATDTLAGNLRRDVSAIRYVIPNLPGGYATAHFNNELLVPRWCTITQNSPGSDVIVTASRRLRVSRNSLKSFNYRMTEDPSGLYRRPSQVRWTFGVQVPDRWEVNLAGQPTQQTKRTVTADLTSTKTVTRVELVPPGTPPVPTDQPTALRLAAASTTVLVVAVTGALLLHAAVLTAFPVATRRRWAAASATSAAVTAIGTVALLTAAFVRARWAGYGWDWASWTYHVGEPVQLPPYILAQQTLVTFCWLVLPLLVLAVAIRKATGRPPDAGALASAALAGPALLVVESAVSGFATWALLVCGIATASAAGVWAVLRSGTFGLMGRRWATVGSAVALAYVSGLSALSLLPGPDASHLPDVDVTWGVAAWPIALAVVLPWALVPLHTPRGLPGFPTAGRTASVLTASLVAGLALPWNGLIYERLPHGVRILAWLTSLVPGRGPVSNVLVVLTPWQIPWVAAALCLLYWLWSHGRDPGKWPDNPRTACMGLIWLAATAPIVGDPGVHLATWLSPVVAAGAYAGAAWIIPTGRKDQAQRLHGVSRAAHVRLTHSLLRAQLITSSRHRFFLDSHGALADGSLTPGEWDTRWNSLSAVSPLHSPDPAGQLLRLRYTALGSSGGYPPWRNGLAAALAVLLLSLPWAISQFWNPLYDSLPQLFTAAGGLLGLWWFSAFSYGYLYPWLRGAGPLGKAACVFVIVWPLQLGLLIANLGGNFRQAAVLLVLLTAQNTLVALGLGLYWEARMVRAAGLPWGQIRNFRRLSSLAVPTTTVLVAAVTAIATVLAGSWATSFTHPSDKPQSVVGGSP